MHRYSPTLVVSLRNFVYHLVLCSSILLLQIVSVVPMSSFRARLLRLSCSMSVHVSGPASSSATMANSSWSPAMVGHSGCSMLSKELCYIRLRWDYSNVYGFPEGNCFQWEKTRKVVPPQLGVDIILLISQGNISEICCRRSKCIFKCIKKCM